MSNEQHSPARCPPSPGLGLFEHRLPEVEDNWACDIGSPGSPAPRVAPPPLAVLLYTRPSSRRAGLGDKAALGDRRGSSKDKTAVTLTTDILQPHYDKPLHATAHALGVCATSIKKACRQLGIANWPYRRIRAAHRELNRMEPLAATCPRALARVNVLHDELRVFFPDRRGG